MTAELLVELGRALYERGITPGRTGNLSCRIDGGIKITPTGLSLGRLAPDSLSIIDDEGTHRGGPPPSKEWPLHLALYRRDPAIGAVAHVHSTHAVAVSTLAEIDSTDALPALTAYYVMRVGRLPLLPYYPPGDPALGEALSGLPAGARCALLANHGSIAAAADLESAVDAVEEIEQAAQLYLLTSGRRLRALSPDQIQATRRR